MAGMRNRRLMVGALVAAVTALVASAAVAVALIGGPSSSPTPLPTMMSGEVTPSGSGATPDSWPTAPKLSGTVVNVSLTDMHGPMMDPVSGKMNAHAMGLSVDKPKVPHGTVSFLVTNAGRMNHEMVILPLADSQTVGARPFGADAKIEETGSLGEASKTGGEGGGEGIVPEAQSWVTVTLAPGRYELVCNLVGHYASGMYAQITVTQ